MAVTNSFKTYARDTRYQTTQSAFTSGMYYTDTPIPESAAKVLVNYDVNVDGTTIAPRRGLQTTKIVYNNDETKYVPKLDKTYQIITCKECYYKDKVYIQILVKENQSPAQDTTIGVFTVDITSETLKENWHVYTKTDDGYTQTDAPQILVQNVSEGYTIHDMPCENFSQHTGCFIGAQYFFFNKSSKKLTYTVFKEDDEKFVFMELEPTKTSPAMASLLGYNMLKENPYTYADEYQEPNGDAEGTIAFSSINAFEDPECTIPAQELLLNQTYYYRFSYSGGGTLKLKYDWTPVTSIAWQEIKTDVKTSGLNNITDTNLPMLVLPFKASAERLMLRVTATRGEDDEPVDIFWWTFDYKSTRTKEAKKPVVYNLSSARTMTYWQNRLVVAGVDEDRSYLFVSSPELFEYFPFPNNADYLDEPIIAVKAFLDDMLVFTKSKLYLYTLDAATGAYTRKCIQTNLNIAEEEVGLIQIVKNMAYFKSGNYYYMIVPKANSTTGELTIAPVYKFVKDFFDDFAESVYGVLKEVYSIDERLPLVKVHNYLDYESMHNVYMLKYDDTTFINFDMLYNTVKRTWSIYVYDSCSTIHVYRQDATKPGRMLCLSHKLSTATQEGIVYNTANNVIQLIDWGTTCEDVHYQAFMPTSGIDTSNATVFNNIQYIDTGLIDLNSNMKKRFRELQFRILNTDKEALQFNTTYFIDGNTKVPAYVYQPVIDNTTGTLILNKELISDNPQNMQTVSSIKLGAWDLSKDAFPGVDVIKIRVPVSGKGYNPQIKISCNNQKDYSLLDITNVYRQLYSR